jgi:pimeloyl-ACP methyl ester carboxylesterase
MVITLPGITGSVLEKDGKDIWALSLQAIFGALTSLGGSVQQLKLDGDDPSIDDLGDGVSATRLIADARLLPGLIKIDGYNKVSEMIKGNFEVHEGNTDQQIDHYPPANYFEFPYDWRRDNRVAAKQLERLISHRLRQWRAFAGAEAKVILLAHSMGGLIARYYLEVLEGWRDCKALITFGTPFRGSVKALDCLANGCGKGLLDLTELVRSFTSVYQLLPIYKMVQVENDWRRIADLEIRGVDLAQTREANAFHQSIRDHVDLRLKGGSANHYILSPVVGTYQPTWQSAEVLSQDLFASERLPPGIDALLNHGDGTVPYLSAIPQEMWKTHQNIFQAESHSSIHCNDQILEYTYYQLQDLQIEGLEDIRGAVDFSHRPGRAAISLSIDELYPTTEPVVIQARLFVDGQELTDMDHYERQIAALKATIIRVDAGGPAIEVLLRREGSKFVNSAGRLAQGLYRVTVAALRQGPIAPFPVHDLFQVFTVA